MTKDAVTAPHVPEDTVSTTAGWRGITVLTAAVLAAIAMYGVGVLLPYYVNDLDRLPLAEVASGAHDPKDLWPRNAFGGLAQLAGFFSLVVLPFMTFVCVGVGGLWLVGLWRHRQAQRVPKSLVLLVVMAASVAALAFMFSATGEALTTWRLD